MDRTLLEVDGPVRQGKEGASWHYAITHNGEHYTQHVFNVPEDGAYRTRILHYPRIGQEGYGEEELWTFADGSFPTLAEALGCGAEEIARRSADPDGEQVS